MRMSERYISCGCDDAVDGQTQGRPRVCRHGAIVREKCQDTALYRHGEMRLGRTSLYKSSQSAPVSTERTSLYRAIQLLCWTTRASVYVS